VDLDHVVNVQLPCRTVTWKELDWTVYGLSASVAAQRAAVWENQIEPWLALNCTGDYNSHVSGIWFSNPSDAMLFKLSWAGYFEK
jgi:hypothetical protein